jgi:hypothetical protein
MVGVYILMILDATAENVDDTFGVCADLELRRTFSGGPISPRLASAHVNLCPKLFVVADLEVDTEVGHGAMPFVFPIALNVRWDEEGCRSGLDGNFGHGLILLFANRIHGVIDM